MKRVTIFTAAVSLAALPCLLPGVMTAQDDEDGWKPLMDGETLEGWHAVGDGTWVVEEGAFVGRADNEKLYGLLVSDKQFKNFTVRYKWQCPAGDSGFYIRTIIKPPEQANGLQVQVGPAGSGAGGIYESYGRGWLSQPKVEDEKEYVKADDWNEMSIAAHGGDVVVHINGVETAKITGDESRPEGHLALQMHAGCVMEVKFKDIEILEAE